MKTINWSGYNWITEERWGQIHFGKSWNWYDPDCVELIDGDLHLSISDTAKKFIDEGGKVVSPNGTGLVCCLSNFGFGRFEIEAKLPKGVGLWPAFWMWATNAWPPEIDIFEGYSGDGNYRGNILRPVKVQSCVHVRNEWQTKKIPARSPWFCQFNNRPDETFNTYTCDWLPDRIEFYINGRSVRKIKDKNILNHLADYKMQVIINNHVDGKYVNHFAYESPFVVKYFNFTPGSSLVQN